MLQYFQMVRDVLTEHNLLNSPAQIYNVDEMGMPTEGLLITTSNSAKFNSRLCLRGNI